MGPLLRPARWHFFQKSSWEWTGPRWAPKERKMAPQNHWTSLGFINILPSRHRVAKTFSTQCFFNDFGSLLRGLAQKELEFHLIYKPFCIAIWSSQNASFHWFYKPFDLCENALRKPSLRNAFPMILRSFLRFRSKFPSNSSCFITFSAIESRLSEKLIFHWFYNVFRRWENAFRKPSLRNAFQSFWGPFCGITQNPLQNLFVL